MAFDAHRNFAFSSVATRPSPATSGTSLTVVAGDGANFPAPPFNITIAPMGAIPTKTNAEIARVTTIVGDVFTIVRAQEASTARSIDVGDLVAATVTAKSLQDIEAVPVARTDQSNTFLQSDQAISGGSWARWIFRDLSQAANQRVFDIMNYAQLLFVRAMDDALATASGSLTFERSGNLKVSADLYEKGRAAPLGHWTAIPYSAGNFTANVGTWTVEAADQVVCQYTLVGKTLCLALQFDTTSVSGGPTVLRMALPGGLSATLTTYAHLLYFDGSGWATAQASGSGTTLLLTKPGGVAWANTTNGTYLAGTIAIPVA